MKKWLVLGIAVALVAMSLAWIFEPYFTLEQLKTSREQLVDWLKPSPVLATAIFFTIYTVISVFSLPGIAAIMTLAAGALFGLWAGTLLVSFASSIGAMLAFLLARFFFRNRVQERFGKWLKWINQGMERDGAFYLFTLRLVPIFPLFLINLTLGLTPIRTWTFYWVSQLGMLPATLVYVNAGTQLAHIENASDVLSVELLLSFALLGLFPWLAKGTIYTVRRARMYIRR
jgi:uncharacterized membrane protein YdjX (TVP38/TMEM64 family)